MAEMIYVVPAAGGRVRQPERAYAVMPAQGGWVPKNPHYERLLAAGDVKAADAPAKISPPADKAETQTSHGRGRSRATAASEG